MTFQHLRAFRPELHRTPQRDHKKEMKECRLREPVPGQAGSDENVGPERTGTGIERNVRTLSRTKQVCEVTKENPMPRRQIDQEFRRGHGF